jgi:hypothetical protein
MRVGRPIKPPPQPCCDDCGGNAQLIRAGEDVYPYREDHGPLWVCPPCGAWISVFARSRRHVPLGRLANAELREVKAKLHEALEPLVAAKVRRDACNPFQARAKAFRWLAGELGIDEKESGIHTLDIAQCKGAIGIVERLEHERATRAQAKSGTTATDRAGDGDD